MIVTIHQPQYIPWINYFEKILRSDVFVILDDVQYQKNGVQNRNKIKTPNGSAWLTLPVHSDLQKMINEIEIVGLNHKIKNLKTLKMNYAKAKYFDSFLEIISETLTNDDLNLSNVSIDIIKNILDIIGYRGDIVKSSDLSVGGVGSEKVLNLCKEVGASSYLSGKGGQNYLDLTEFNDCGIGILMQDYSHPVYNQCHNVNEFILDLSIIDLIFNEGENARKIIEKNMVEYIKWEH